MQGNQVKGGSAPNGVDALDRVLVTANPLVSCP